MMSKRSDRAGHRCTLWAIGVLFAGVFGGCQPAQTPDAEPPDAAPPASGITRLQIDSVEPAFEGREFGSAGQYEVVLGRAFGELDPTDPNNAVIVNLDRAPRNARGLVEYSADFRILKPADMTRGNGAIFYDVPNRGYQRSFNLVQDFGGPYGSWPVTAADVGDGFQLALGYTLVWSGWQADVPTGDHRLTAQLPIATQPDGGPIRGWRTIELNGDSPVRSRRIEGGIYPVVAESMPEAKLYRRANPHATPELLSRESWSFAKCDGSAAAVRSNVDVCLPAGFSPDALYYLVAELQDPIVMGIGFAAVRDFASFLRHDSTEDNPLVSHFGGSESARNVITTAIVFGKSQPGRFIRDFIYHGFNRDPMGRLVFEGAIPATAGARQTFINYEFGSPGRFVRNVSDHYYPGDQFPFAYETLTDPVTGRVDGLLARCRLTQTCPKVMHFDSANEMWSARGSLVTTDPLGMTDMPIPDNVRIYQVASTQHRAGTGEETLDELEAMRDGGVCQYLPNRSPFREAQRALLVAMHAWVTTGTLPPPSQYSKLADGTLVPALPQASQGFPSIPGVPYLGKVNDLFVNDYRAHPAKHATGEYTVLIPKVDSDGNDLAGIRSTRIQVPLGTYTGWNARRAGHVEDEGCGTTGSYFPFARTAAEWGSDPRPSLEERYGTPANYVEQVRAAAERLQETGFLLARDAERLIREAEQRDLGSP